MLAGRFPVLMFSFIIRMLVSFWAEIEQAKSNYYKPANVQYPFAHTFKWENKLHC